MNQFNFKSQICTSREQSERLLSLGLKKETADMTWEFSHTKNGVSQYDCRAESSWDSETFARYVEHCEKIGYFEHWKHEDGSQMTPEEVYDEIMKIHIPAWSLHRLWELYWSNKVVSDCLFGCGKYMNPYAKMIAMIESDIEDGTFNKDYLDK